MPENFYIVLGLTRGADLNKIKKAYRSSVKKYHPDAPSQDADSEKFREIQEAYDTLGDEEKRRRYDRKLAREGTVKPAVPVTQGIRRRRSAVDEMESAFSVADAFFSGWIPGFYDSRMARSKDLYLDMILSPGEAETGGLFPITVPVYETCPRCTGSVFWRDAFCPVCGGYGKIQSERSFSLSVPAHVPNGTEVTISMEDIGLKGADVHITVLIDPNYGEEWW